MTLPKAIRTALERNAQQLSPITLTLVEYPPGYSGPQGRIDDWPVPDAVKEGEGPFPGMMQGQLLRITWQDAKFYTWRRMKSGRPETESIYESSIDGRVHYSRGCYPEGPALILKTRLDDPRENWPDAKCFDTNFFEACGIDMPTIGGLITSEPAHSTILQLLDHGGELLAVDSNRIRILADNPERVAAERADLKAAEAELRRIGTLSEAGIQEHLAEMERRRQLPAKWVYTFDLDPELHFAPVKIEATFEDGTLIKRSSAEDFQSFAGRDLHLPRKCLIEYFKRTPAPQANPTTLERVYQLVEADGKSVVEDRFAIEPNDPETHMVDRTKSIARR